MKLLVRLIPLTLLAVASSVEAADWSGIRVYVGHPQEAWSGSSTCAPCNRFCADLRAYNRRLKELGGTGWRIGYTESGAGGRPNRIVILRAMDDDATPSFVGVLNGVETAARIDGYDAADPARTIDAILRLDPIGTKPVEAPARTPPPPRTLSDAEPPRQRITIVRETIREVAPSTPLATPFTPSARSAPRLSAYTPHWTWPGDLRDHLHRTHGYARRWLDSLTRDELEALHDRDHDSGRVTPAGTQRWGASAQPVRARSSGVELLGLPVYQQWTTRSACPGGICPR
jgi:hypothetical protein